MSDPIVTKSKDRAARMANDIAHHRPSRQSAVALDIEDQPGRFFLRQSVVSPTVCFRFQALQALFSPSGKDGFDYAAVHIRQSKVTAAVSKVSFA
jgi:hypothetical protein